MRKRFLLLGVALCLLLSSLLLSSCGAETYKAYSFDYFDTATIIIGQEKDKETFDRVSARILEELETYHKLYDIYHRYEGIENLCTVNELVNGAHRTVSVDARIIDLLAYAKEMYRLTDGATNVAMGSVLSIWHDYRTAGIDEPWAAELPPMEKLTEAAGHTDIDCIVIDRENGTVTLTDPKMKLDVGAVAKGYAVEMIARGLEADGITGYVLNVGGNVRTVGGKKDETPWTVGIENPDGEDYLAYLNLCGEALVTSGSYQRYYTVDGKQYHHIIDPETLMPAEGYRSVSLICKSSADGDALSTALFCMDLTQGMALVASLPDVEALWVTEDGKTYASDGFHEYEKS